MNALIEENIFDLINPALNAKSKDHIDSVRKVVQIALHDPLTRVFNRRTIMDIFNGSGAPRLVTLVDTKGLKAVNSEIGYRAGDDYLINCLGNILQILNENDSNYSVGRIGGDEFLIIQYEYSIALKDNPEILRNWYVAESKFTVSSESHMLDTLDTMLKLQKSMQKEMQEKRN